MNVISLIAKEIRHHKLNSALTIAAVVTAVGLFVGLMTAGEAYRKGTRKVQLGMGQNLRIIPRQTRMDKFWAAGYSEFTMPEEYLARFASLEGYEYTHLTGTLQKKVLLRGREVILTGLLPEVMPPDRNQPPMTFSVERGEIYVGYEVARIFAIEEGDEVEVLGRSLRVVSCLAPTGSSDDIRIYGHLHDVQDLLGLSGRINEIKALECLCLIEAGKTGLDPLTLAQQQLAEILPEGKVLLLEGIARVRQEQRALMEGYLGLIMPLVIVACGIWIGALSMLNVRQRRSEIGLLRALGYGSVKIAVLFLGRAGVIGLVGAGLGFALGTGLALRFGSDIFKITAPAIKAEWSWLPVVLVLAPLFAVLAGLIPTARAVGMDPAITLTEE